VRGCTLFRWHQPPWKPREAAQCCFLGSTPNYSPKHLTSLGYLYFILIPVSFSFSASSCAVPAVPSSFWFCDLSWIAEVTSHLVTQPESQGCFRIIQFPSFLRNTTGFFCLMRWPVKSCEWRSGWPLVLSRPGYGIGTEMLSFAVLSRLEIAPCLFPQKIFMNNRSFFFLCLNGEEK